jgi:hypothetical protein
VSLGLFAITTSEIVALSLAESREAQAWLTSELSYVPEILSGFYVRRAVKLRHSTQEDLLHKTEICRRVDTNFREIIFQCVSVKKGNRNGRSISPWPHPYHPRPARSCMMKDW